MTYSSASTAAIVHCRHSLLTQNNISINNKDSVVHLDLTGKNHSFEDNNVDIFSRVDMRWFERAVTESIYNWNKSLWTEEVDCDVTYHPPTMQYWVPSPDS